MENIREHINNLIFQYSNRTITPEEEEELLLWVEEREENRKYFKEQITVFKSIDKTKVQFNSKQYFNEFLKNTTSSKNSISRRWIAIAASITILITLGSIIFTRYLERKSEVIQLTAGNSISTYTLEDNSEISLSKNSTLIKPRVFEGKIRELELIGKAYFEISKDVSRPFIITAGKTRIEVIGTGFQVEMDSISSVVKIAVSEGKVVVSSRESNLSKMVTKGKQITVNHNGVVIEEIILLNENHLAWKTGILVFNKTPLKEVADEIARHYGKMFLFEDLEIEDYTLTSNLDKRKLNEIGAILKIAFDIDVKEQNDTIVLSKK